MAKRNWLIRADSEIQTFVDDGAGELLPGPTIPVVSQEALAKGTLEGVVMMERAGGVLSVAVRRVVTGVPNERVVAEALVEWKDRVDARAQPERDSAALAPSQEQPAAPPVPQFEPIVRDGVVQHAEESVVGTDAHGNEVDEKDVPLELRGS